MGHVRLGTLPRTREWNEVVRLIADGANVPEVAEATFEAADKAFSRMANDTGFNEAVWLLIQFGVAANKPIPAEHLESIGIKLSTQTSVAEVASAINTSHSEEASHSRAHSDIGSLANKALVSAITAHLSEKLGGLFEASSTDVYGVLAKLGKGKEFGRLSRSFFSKITEYSLKYFLDKTIDTHLGQGQRFQTRDDSRTFREALTIHCREASEVVEDFASEWFSKTRFEGHGDIHREKTEGFGWYAVEKIRSEMRTRSKSHE